MYKFSSFLMIICLGLFFVACGGGSEGGTASDGGGEEKAAEAGINPNVMAAGGGVYKQYCIACHMENGEGVMGLNPPLTETEYVLGDKERLIEIALNGLTGEIEVNGEIYNSIMTPHNFLSDAQLAHVLTYVRNSFGNKASAVSIEEVAAVRAKTQ